MDYDTASAAAEGTGKSVAVSFAATTGKKIIGFHLLHLRTAAADSQV